MPSFAVVEQRTLAILHADHPCVALDGTAFVGSVDDGLEFGVEAKHVHHHPGTFGELAELLALLIKQV